MRFRKGAVKEGRPKLTVLVGPPASGKSTYANKVKGPDVLVVSSDEIRYKMQKERFGDAYSYRPELNPEVFSIFKDRVTEGLEKGLHVIADATNVNYRDRSSYRDIKRVLNKKNIYPYMEAVVMVDSIHNLLLHDKGRKEQAVGEKSIVRLLKKFRVPNPRIEEWDSVKLYNKSISSDSPRDYFIFLDRESENFDQKNKWHTLTLGGHIEELKEMSPNSRLRTISQYHDYGKLFTQEFKDGQARYYGHANVSSYLYLYSLAEEAEKELTVEQIENSLIIERHMTRLDEWKPTKAITEMGLEAYFLLNEFDEIDKRGGSKKGSNRYEGLTPEDKFDILNSRRRDFFKEMEDKV